MKTNFFSKLLECNLKQITITIRYTDDGQVTVAILPKSNTKDKGFKQLIPLTFTDSVEEMDNSFLEDIQKPLLQASKLIDNMEAFQAQLEEAERNSDMKKKEKESLKKKTEDLKQMVSKEGFELDEKTIPKVRGKIEEILKIDSKNKLANDWNTKIKKQSQANLFS